MKRFIAFLGIWGVCAGVCFAQEQITLTTYYPAPFGIYQELAARRMKIGATYMGPGTTVADNNLIVEGRVGINTPTPQGSLDVNGGARFGQVSVACAPAVEGVIRYDSILHVYQYCDGTAWRSFTGKKMASGVAQIPRQTCGLCTVTVPLPALYFTSPPRVIISPQWLKQTGDEDSTWYVSNVGVVSFNINFHTPGDGNFSGEDGVMWVAVEA